MDLGNFLQSLGQSLGFAPGDQTLTRFDPASLPQGAPSEIASTAPGALPANFLQQATGDVPNAAPASAPPPQQNAEPPRTRRSLLDTIGRISDVLAKVGGAEALYQPSLDARAAQAQQVDLDAMRKQLLQQQIGAGQDEAAGRKTALLGNAVRGLQAIQARGGDVAKAWPILAQQAGIDSAQADHLGQVFAADPNNIRGIAAMLNGQQEFGLQPFYAKDANGNLAAYQIGKDGSIQPVQLPEGQTPIDPLKFVDLGGQMAGVGTRSNTVSRILPKTEAPGKAADRASRERIAAAGNASRENIAATSAAAKGAGKASGNSDEINASLDLLNNVEKGFSDLHNLHALAGESLLGPLSRTAIGQAAGEQFGTAAAQKRLEVQKNISQLQQSMLKSLPASATRTKFEQEMLARGLPDPFKMNAETAATVIGQLRQSYMQALKNLKSEQSAAAPAGKPKITPRASSGGWGKATVVGN